ncbi:hypothetical protein ADUPG1_000566 [Aduncisulcus paluster]|uniref:Uncharacterized protein n=1 Tax=Aduncisulcus paluster TaxID=2918883 RepID=A0ABQ5K6V2_9EUKA|nr:hypothetical protein ADUPG1_000566 [Aduncisulcus paluster]
MGTGESIAMVFDVPLSDQWICSTILMTDITPNVHTSPRLREGYICLECSNCLIGQYRSSSVISLSCEWMWIEYLSIRDVLGIVLTPTWLRKVSSAYVCFFLLILFFILIKYVCEGHFNMIWYGL